MGRSRVAVVRSRGASRGATGVVQEAPETIPGLLAWWDPASDYITKDGSNNVSAWVSREGNSYTLSQASGPAQFTWSATGILGKPSLAGAGAQYMEGAAALAALIDGTAAHTIYAVVDYDSTAVGALCSVATSASSNNLQCYRTDFAGNTYIDALRIESGGGTTTNTTSTAIGTSPEYIAWLFTGSAISYRIGGAAVSGGANTRSTTCDLFVLGARKLTGTYSQYINGKISDVFIYDHVLTAGEIATLETWVTTKYAGI